MASIELMAANQICPELALRPVALTFDQIHPSVRYTVPAEHLDKAFGPFGHAINPENGEPAELHSIVWHDGTWSWGRHHWAKDKEHKAKRITVTTLGLTPVVIIDRSQA